ncbi:hypothetical protein RS030_4621 [Cryptosporidium xiaoi]|uniref:SUN domain-containing protein n=1 Tax=Cryptosporidium xiaoi TaxID=659607 RepID=A0AAV9XV92_9CRYT
MFAIFFSLIIYSCLKNTNFSYYNEESEHVKPLFNTREETLYYQKPLENVNTSENLDTKQMNNKFEDIENSIVGLNKKISTMIEMNEEKSNDNNKIIQEKMRIIDANLSNIASEFMLFKSYIKEDLKHMKKETYENRKHYFQDNLSKTIGLLKNNITEIERTNDNLRIEFDKLYQEIKLIDEAQDVLKSMILSINKRSENQLGLNPTQISQKSFHFTKEIENYIQDLIQIKYEMKGFSRIDWAQSSMGGKVIYPEKNKYCEINANINEKSPLIKGIIYAQNKISKYITKGGTDNSNYHIVPIYKNNCFKPSDLINSNIIKTTGNCLLIPVNSDVIIELSTLVNITSVGIDHVLSQLDYENGETVPRNISFECVQTPFEKNKVSYFTYYYPQNGSSLQVNPVNPGIVCKKVKFSIISSYGGSHVCLYKLRIYGDLFKNGMKRRYNGGNMKVLNILINKIPGLLIPLFKNSFSFTTGILKFVFKYIRSSFGYLNKHRISKGDVKDEKVSLETNSVVTSSDTNKNLNNVHNDYRSEHSELDTKYNFNKIHEVNGNNSNKKKRERELK